MTGQEFLEALARALRSELTEQEVADNIRYYETYISQEMRSGKSEEQVIAQLGDPRLIARTILDVDQQSWMKTIPLRGHRCTRFSSEAGKPD